MISYNQLPLEIKESGNVYAVRKKAKSWEVRHLLSEYMFAYTHGVKDNELHGIPADADARDYQMLNIAIYFVLRKEIFKRMTPLVGKRAPEMLLLDNKKLLDRLDMHVLNGVDKDERGSQACIIEICNRLD